MTERLPQTQPVSENGLRNPWPWSTSVIEVDAIPLLNEAAALEGDVKVKFLEAQGQAYTHFNGKEELTAVVPQGFVRIMVIMDKTYASDFWNTFEALKAFELSEREKSSASSPISS